MHEWVWDIFEMILIGPKELLYQKSNRGMKLAINDLSHGMATVCQEISAENYVYRPV